jgi:diacylglycerol kinase family enzyme
VSNGSTGPGLGINVAAAPTATVPEIRPSSSESAGAPASKDRRAAKKRMLVIVNPYATTVSDRLKNLFVYALQGRFEVEAVSTEAQNHATEIGREARKDGYDVIVVFGGDGTLNEVVNGLAGADIPVSVLPGGSTNVVCRTLGIPNDVVEATEHLLGSADDFRPRKIDLGNASGRRFVFAWGAGLDATVTQRVDAHPRLKAQAGPYYYSWAAVSSFYRRYLSDPVQMRVEVGDREVTGITAVAQNSDPYTYFANRPIRVCEGIDLDDGTLSLAVLRRAAQRDVPSLIPRLLSERWRTVRHRQIEHFADVTEARIVAASRDASGQPRAFPVQVDGDFIGERTEVRLSVEPRALSVIA